MNKILVLIVSFLFSSLSYGTVDNSDLDHIVQLTKEGRYQQALEKHLWFHEASKTSQGMGGVRLSYALDEWVRLGKNYPAAMDALIGIRDDNKELLLSGQGDFQNFLELSSINRVMGDREATLDLFIILDEKYPDQAQSYYHAAERLLIENKAYDISARYIGDPILKYEGLRHMRERNLGLARGNPDLNTPRFIAYADESFVNDVLSLIEILVAVGQADEALEVQKRALSYFESDRIMHAIP
ncbi:hypothetical protein [Halopseudomonas salegens]|uniref:Tetratricopeptide repeat protein n=1 Tax=Halopseudomonas salegens TaxID=1434072 RepID=A0A1H2G7T5_9GAMM|nr:hypothetical protein [Halopseudomonas salegens]SDU15438.1 hypothetical protein SAMN05216210_2090 [Halopseudomonas salegens]